MAYIQPWKCVRQKHNTQSSQTLPSPWSLLRAVVLRVRVGVGQRLCRCLGRHPLTERLLRGWAQLQEVRQLDADGHLAKPLLHVLAHVQAQKLLSQQRKPIAGRVIHIWRIHGQLVHHRGRRLGNLRLHGAALALGTAKVSAVQASVWAHVGPLAQRLRLGAKESDSCVGGSSHDVASASKEDGAPLYRPKFCRSPLHFSLLAPSARQMEKSLRLSYISCMAFTTGATARTCCLFRVCFRTSSSAYSAGPRAFKSTRKGSSVSGTGANSSSPASSLPISASPVATTGQFHETKRQRARKAHESNSDRKPLAWDTPRLQKETPGSAFERQEPALHPHDSSCAADPRMLIPCCT